MEHVVTDLRNPYTLYHDSSLASIAYFQGKRIVRDSVDDLYYEVIPASSCQTTDILNMDRLRPITELSKQEQAAIIEFCKDID
jgi:hypothetical protein